MNASGLKTRHPAPAPAGAFGVGTVFSSLARRPALWLGLDALAVLGYGYAAAVPAVGVDDLAIAAYQQGGGFLRQSRVTVWLLQALTGLMAYRPHWPEVFAALCLAAAGLLLACLLYAASGRTPTVGGALLAAGGVLLYPWHAEILAYSNQCGIGFALLLAVAAAALVRRHLLAGWSAGWPGAAGAVACLTFSLGYYESMAQVWLTLVCMLLLTDAAFAPPRSRRWHWAAAPLVRGLWPLAAALLARKGLTIALCALTGTTGEDGAAAKTIYWLRRSSVGEALRIFVREFLSNYLSLPFGVPARALLVLGCAGLVVWAAVRRRGNGCGVLTAALLATLFALGVLQGTGSQMARTCQCFAVFVPYAAWLLLGSLPRRRIAAVLGAALLAAECLALNAGFAADRDRWRTEQAALQAVAARLDEMDPGRAVPVAFTGSYTLPEAQQHKLPASNPAYKVAYLLSVTLGQPMGDLYAYEEVNESVIQWALEAFGGREQMYLLMEHIGRPCALPTPDQQAAADAAGLPSGTVTRLNDCLVVTF